VRRGITDPVLETVLALITPYAAYVAGEALHVSPVMTVIVAGLAIGARRDRITTAQTRLQLNSVYQTVIFLLESVVFSLIRLQLPTLIRDLSRTRAWPAEALAVAATLIVIRMLWGFPLSAVARLADEPRPTGSFPYGPPDRRRLRIGRYQVMYDITAETMSVCHLGRGWAGS